MPTQHPVLRRRALLRAFPAAVAASLAIPAFAKSDFPQGPLRVIVGLPPGGAADAIVRAMSKELQTEMNTPVIVENRPGGQFVISVQALMSGPADGQTLLYTYSGYAAIQATEHLFDMERDMTAVAQVATSPIVLLARGDSPYRSVEDVLAFARANPERLTYGTFGPASLEHLKMAMIEKAAGFKGVAVPYRGGPDMAKALIGGEIDLTLSAGIFAKMYAPTGKVRVLAVLGAERWNAFPDVPTLREAGVDVAPLFYWGGYLVRAGTPADRVDRLSRALAKVSRMPAVVERIQGTGQEVDVRDGQAFGQIIQRDVQWMRKMHESLNA